MKMSKPFEIFSVFWLAFFCAAACPIFSSDLHASGHNTVEQLEKAFTSAFACPEEFKSTKIFHLLGYTEAEIAAIGKITPRPVSLKVEIDRAEASDEFANIKVTCSQVRYYNLTIATATFEFPECKVDMQSLKQDRIRFTRSNGIKLKTEVSESDILKVFELFARAKSLRDLRLQLEKNRARLGGWYRAGFLTISFRVLGNVELVNPKVVNFDCSRFTLNRIPLPKHTARSMLSRINPVFDSTKTWLNLNIEDIKILDGYVETIARIDKKKG